MPHMDLSELYSCLKSVYLEYSHSGVTKQQLSSAHFLDLEGSSRTERYKLFGNSFQADTVNLFLVKAISGIYFSIQHTDSDNYSSDYETIFQDDFTDIDSSSDIEEILNSDFDEENKLLYLTKMGYSEAEASIAMEICDPNSSIAELIDFMCTAQMAKVANALIPIEDRKPLCNDPNYKQRRNLGYDIWKRKKQRKLEKKLLNENDHAIHLPNPMIGFGFPTEPDQIIQRTLLEDAIGPLYFYFENVALAPVGVWTKMSRDAEVAFYCLGIPLKTDVQELNDDQLEQLMSRFVEFDLVVGGISCRIDNNLLQEPSSFETVLFEKNLRNVFGMCSALSRA
ncbi:shaggy-related protein kinase epsilon [Hibiscus syriacus]|uniref:Shaggy-related protein kinase epsilon n=1 Tax=Hibiscus syriacus TaxID=106335 RepID=A0A6A2ZJD0_HIBSY|nr:shaggy-related protein kinase epsilon [Hibiscus syriacus]